MNKWIFLGFLAFLLIVLPQSADYPYYFDDYRVLAQVKEISSNPLSAFNPTHHFGRRAPFFLYFLFLEKTLFGFNSLPYFFVLFCLHFLNALLVARIGRALGATATASTLAGLLFLCSSSSYQDLIFIHLTTRVLCIFLFLLTTHFWISFLQSRTCRSFLKTMAFQVLSVFTKEDAVIFPLIALFLSFRLVTKEGGRRTVLTRYWPWLLLTNVLSTLLLLQSFLSHPRRAEILTMPGDGIAKIISLVEVFLRPLFVPERGFFAPFFIPEDVIRLLPALLVLVLLLRLFWSRERLKFFLSTLSLRQLITGAGWVFITTVPFLFQPLTFEHANRYLYLPLAGFGFLFGAVMAGIIETVRNFFPRKAMTACWLVIAYILSLGLYTTAWEYRRYVKYVEERPKEHYYDETKELFESPIRISTFSSRSRTS